MAVLAFAAVLLVLKSFVDGMLAMLAFSWELDSSIGVPNSAASPRPSRRSLVMI
ncbi:MAG: hypothetical protein ACK55Z_28305 [bacterium]